MHLGATNAKEDYYMRGNHGQERKLEETVLGEGSWDLCIKHTEANRALSQSS